MTINTKLTDERPDDEGLELLITIRREIAERHASEGRAAQCAVHTLILNALLELQERRKADGAEPIYQLFDAGWYDTNKSTYDTVTGTGMKGRIVYATHS
ncbi:hypothetical protein I3B18_03895 [Salmonella enterica]|uniref:hypothetical protein n=1 Tax=Salmonella enterica TaxID=28901 RepID=UPI0018D0F9DD|nr:hypothetical protein [Salmonella enterica]MBH0545351.1 hypothetical protein [Salmonella enterica]MBH0558413.1 hypothetical protein [Salmonella enterica]MBH0589707.1 hypothetical protein [Salmonella enterica]MBH0617195.1 hypothetical protein [Salmonella enterica]MBH0634691.1 hypothetical protein [Salmonella enterica]